MFAFGIGHDDVRRRSGRIEQVAGLTRGGRTLADRNRAPAGDERGRQAADQDEHDRGDRRGDEARSGQQAVGVAGRGRRERVLGPRLVTIRSMRRQRPG